MRAPHSPLQLDAFLVSSLRFKTNALHRPEQPSSGSVDVEPELLRHKAQPHKHALRLAIRYRPEAKESNPAPYSVAVEGLGFFTVAEGISDEEELKLVIYNGSAMLYSLLRAQIAQVTALAPHGPLLLPTVNLVPVLDRYLKHIADGN